MPLFEQETLKLLAYEAFIRRAGELGLPFMLKGSYVTRQYFADPTLRTPQDLDWVYLPPLASAEEAERVFTAWATAATELVASDSVRFRSFRENAFWRILDYAMADDFPTTNTDLVCWVDGQEFDRFSLDISFNLPLGVPSEPLWYQPMRGEPFLVPYSTPLALQIAWKLHQTLVRPRFKDLFDLLHLLKHPTFSPAVRQQTLEALAAECAADNTDLGRLRWLLAGNLAPLFTDTRVADAWLGWRHGQPAGHLSSLLHHKWAATLTNPTLLPKSLADFQQLLQATFQHAGFDANAAGLPAAPSISGNGFWQGLRSLF
ncbi:nucleotidyl transferase AbiEii/AbiGii toxin family protein [Hymenobacter cheonanensis]|uniref:nucleotidyl transferase AbiEii/AbiGii toxin family protein n=1 Tax=Hymenobacter sp. CA2-7 TaxID=3063993 RepID=UPI002712CF42|nr:nucleotidyl transferase AbiEii/AbiGii toxin family protein [Hymenobacter sp. CA2-7]MDO7885587.1 nucleotidyl transferase AbiEii/AbiGii toxin family protein [Hymenobacter sp. CA2-7]